MRKSAITILQLFFVTVLAAQHNIILKVDSLPANPQTYELYIAGSFNGWNPASEAYHFRRMGNGQFYIDLKLAAGTYEYKITRGSWNEVECNPGGAVKENRILKVDHDDSYMINIREWKDNFPDKEIIHSASSHVSIIDTAFYMPQLKRKRRVWVYLPADYKKKAYPVLYLHDGQNVFDDATSYAGEWGIDEFLDSTRLSSSIVVAVDNGGDKRMNEYGPYDMKRFGKGEGRLYVDFLVKTLKPYVDKKYNTLTDCGHTYIAGSSMGGLISMYAILRYPKVFGGAGVFSPSFWAAPDIYNEINKKGKKVCGAVYFYAGTAEGEEMVPDMEKAYNAMSAISSSRIKKVVREAGTHNETTWRKEFPLFYDWLINSLR